MKKLILLFLVSMSINAFAQKEVKEGVMTSKVTMSSDNEQMSAQFTMLGDMVITTYFKGNKSRGEMNNPLAGETTTIIDNDIKKTLALINNPMLGKKYKESSINVSEEDTKNLTVKTNGKSKTVVGYNCTGYDIITKQNGQEIKMEMYVTDKILAQEQYSAMLDGKVKGYPLYMVVSMNQPGIGNINTTMEVTELKSQKIEDSKFEMTIPEGYTEIVMPKPAKID